MNREKENAISNILDMLVDWIEHSSSEHGNEKRQKVIAAANMAGYKHISICSYKEKTDFLLFRDDDELERFIRTRETSGDTNKILRFVYEEKIDERALAGLRQEQITYFFM